ncbi:MAG: hypothetical protein JJU45_00805 [Acidimicrobiia bacterium]|nr:hypothetical protein [Acidimicrobiia bacterium]
MGVHRLLPATELTTWGLSSRDRTASRGVHRLLPATELTTLAGYEAAGGGEALARLHDLGPEWVLDQLDAAGLRGRGGGGFPTATKWRSVRGGGAEVGTRYVVANGAEGEPGTFKDRTLLRANPFAVLEGLVVAARVVGAETAYLALKRTFVTETALVRQAIDEMDGAGWLDGLHIELVLGPSEYLFGEEKALLEVIEGEDPLPRLVPPYLYGLFSTAPQLGWSAGAGDGDSSNPTVVNNVETLAHAGTIVANGAEWFRAIGTEGTPGSLLVTVSGDTRRAGVAEMAAGTPLRTAIDEIGGGVTDGRAVKAVLSGVANPVVTSEQLDVPLCFDAFGAIGSGLGAAGFVVYDGQRNMVGVAHAVSQFLHVESCGQCPACKFGTGEVTARLEQLLVEGGQPDAIDTVAARLRSVTDANRCYLGTQEQQVVASLLATFPDDVDRVLAGDPGDPVPPVAPITDITDGTALRDERQANKRPDWTYGEQPLSSLVRRRQAPSA